MLVTMKQAGVQRVNSGADTVLCSFPMPPQSRLVNVQGTVTFGPMAVIALDQVCASALSGFVLPVKDPDGNVAADTIWDEEVPKDAAQADDAIDLDAETADASPEWEPGLPDLITILGLEQHPEWFRRRTWMDINSHPNFIHLDTTVKYLPGEVVRIKAQPRIGTDIFALAMLGFSSILSTITTTTTLKAPTKQQWGMLMFLETTIVDMMKLLFSLPEAGAESPYEDASIFLADLTEPAVMEVAARAADFIPVNYNVNYRVTAQIFMKEHGEINNLASG